MNARFALAMLGALGGCAEEFQPEVATEQTLRGLTSEVRLLVTGPEADRDKEERCRRVAADLGVHLNDRAVFSIRIHLRSDGNRLILSARNEELADLARPGWGMERLCNNAFAVAARVVEETRRRPVVAGSAPVVAAVAAAPVVAQVAAAPPAPARPPAPPRPGVGRASDGRPPSAGLVAAAPPPRSRETSLLLRTVPPGARLIVDRAEAGTAPLRADNVSPGIHVVEAWWADGHFAIRQVRVRRFGGGVIELRSQ